MTTFVKRSSETSPLFSLRFESLVLITCFLLLANPFVTLSGNALYTRHDHSVIKIRKVRSILKPSGISSTHHVEVDMNGEKLVFDEMEQKGKKDCIFKRVKDEGAMVDQELMIEKGKENPFIQVWNPETSEFEVERRKEIIDGEVVEEQEEIGDPQNEDGNHLLKKSIRKRAITLKDSIRETWLHNHHGRYRRQADSTMKQTANLQLAIFIDEALYKLFADEYGKKKADQAIAEYVDFVVDTAEILWDLDTITPNLKIQLAQDLVIWKKQPKGMPNGRQGDVSEYLDAARAYIAPGDRSGIDHASVWTGLDLKFVYSTGKKGGVNGVARRNGICSDEAVSVINANPHFIGAGYTFAHELGHNMGMCHDGDKSCPLAAECGKEINIMTSKGTGNGYNQLQWSECSVLQFQMVLMYMDALNYNCLADKVRPEPIGISSYPGQRLPPEATCQEMAGRCARHVAQKQAGSCRMVYCTMKNNFKAVSRFGNKYLSEGSYCGPNKICMSGECVKIEKQLGDIKPVDGGWSEKWEVSDSKHCNANSCDRACEAKNQQLISFEYRKCSNPYPLNGGKPCKGLNVRARRCPKKKKCRSKTTIKEWREQFCDAKYSDTKETKDWKTCRFSCIRMNKKMYVYDDLDGTPCKRKKKNGMCVNGVCMTQCKKDRNLFADNDKDCHVSSEHEDLHHLAAKYAALKKNKKKKLEKVDLKLQEKPFTNRILKIGSAKPPKPKSANSACSWKFLPHRKITNPGNKLTRKKYKADHESTIYICKKKKKCRMAMLKANHDSGRGTVTLYHTKRKPTDYKYWYKAHGGVTMQLCGCSWLTLKRASYTVKKERLKWFTGIRSQKEAEQKCDKTPGCNLISYQPHRGKRARADLFKVTADTDKRTYQKEKTSKKRVIEKICG